MLDLTKNDMVYKAFDAVNKIKNTKCSDMYLAFVSNSGYLRISLLTLTKLPSKTKPSRANKTVGAYKARA